jgi:RNA polymerase sigma-70 factor, ECF subfamily
MPEFPTNMNSAEHFEAIVSEHYEALYRFAMSLTRSESDAGDLTQHTFYIWAAKGHQLHDRSKVKAWLFTTLHRAFLQGRRRQVRFPQCDLNDVQDELPPIEPRGISSIDAEHVLAALAKMDSVHRPAVALFYLEDYSYMEIAAILEIPLGTVKSRITRGLVQLRKLVPQAISPKRAPAHWDSRSSPALELMSEL